MLVAWCSKVAAKAVHSLTNRLPFFVEFLSGGSYFATPVNRIKNQCPLSYGHWFCVLMIPLDSYLLETRFGRFDGFIEVIPSTLDSDF